MRCAPDTRVQVCWHRRCGKGCSATVARPKGRVFQFRFRTASDSYSVCGARLSSQPNHSAKCGHPLRMTPKPALATISEPSATLPYCRRPNFRAVVARRADGWVVGPSFTRSAPPAVAATFSSSAPNLLQRDGFTLPPVRQTPGPRIHARQERGETLDDRCPR